MGGRCTKDTTIKDQMLINDGVVKIKDVDIHKDTKENTLNVDRTNSLKPSDSKDFSNSQVVEINSRKVSQVINNI